MAGTWHKGVRLHNVERCLFWGGSSNKNLPGPDCRSPRRAMGENSWPRVPREEVMTAAAAFYSCQRRTLLGTLLGHEVASVGKWAGFIDLAVTRKKQPLHNEHEKLSHT
ncbi:hypothetical protein IF2G_02254 [Cordyceps javanica]|nr:hypothetical protein IF2G_02254 [Cordyceps javanica]